MALPFPSARATRRAPPIDPLFWLGGIGWSKALDFSTLFRRSLLLARDAVNLSQAPVRLRISRTKLRSLCPILERGSVLVVGKTLLGEDDGDLVQQTRRLLVLRIKLMSMTERPVS